MPHVQLGAPEVTVDATTLRRLQRLGAGKAHMAAVRRRTAASLGTKEMTNLIDLRAISLVAHLSVM